MNIRITKKFRMELAHRLPYHEGLCKNIHGHSYELDITVKGEPRLKKGDPEDGMVMDFSKLKSIVKDSILDHFDHSFVFSADDKSKLQIETKSCFIDSSPTCEMLLLEFVGRMLKQLPSNVTLVSMKLSETSTSYAEWLLEDNQNA